MARLLRRRRDTADARRRILDAALRLVASGGANELTQPKVSRAAGLRQGHLTYYFPTRADLLQAVAKHSIETLLRSLAGAPPGAAGRLPDLVARGAADPRRARLMLALVSAADRDPAIRRRLRRFIADMRRNFSALLEARGVAPRHVAFIHTVVVGAAVLQLARRDAQSKEEARDVLRHAFANAGLRGH